MKRACAVFIAVVILGLLVGWYGGIDWTERSGFHAFVMVEILIVAAAAFCAARATE